MQKTSETISEVGDIKLTEIRYDKIQVGPEDKIVVYLDYYDEDMRDALTVFFGCKEVVVLPVDSRIEVYTSCKT